MEYDDYTDEDHAQWVEDGRPVPTGRKHCTSCDTGERIELAFYQIKSAPLECIADHGRYLCEDHGDHVCGDYPDEVDLGFA